MNHSNKNSLANSSRASGVRRTIYRSTSCATTQSVFCFVWFIIQNGRRSVSSANEASLNSLHIVALHLTKTRILWAHHPGDKRTALNCTSRQDTKKVISLFGTGPFPGSSSSLLCPNRYSWHMRLYTSTKTSYSICMQHGYNHITF